VPDTVVTLRRGTDGGDATATGGTASTRRGNASAWLPLIGTPPAGDWQLSLPADATPLFDTGALDDIALIISWAGRSPAWEV